MALTTKEMIVFALRADHRLTKAIGRPVPGQHDAIADWVMARQRIPSIRVGIVDTLPYDAVAKAYEEYVAGGVDSPLQAALGGINDGTPYCSVPDAGSV